MEKGLEVLFLGEKQKKVVKLHVEFDSFCNFVNYLRFTIFSVFTIGAWSSVELVFFGLKVIAYGCL